MKSLFKFSTNKLFIGFLTASAADPLFFCLLFSVFLCFRIKRAAVDFVDRCLSS